MVILQHLVSLALHLSDIPLQLTLLTLQPMTSINWSKSALSPFGPPVCVPSMSAPATKVAQEVACLSGMPLFVLRTL